MTPPADPAESGWSFDMSAATGASELHLGALTYTDGPLNINLGNNTTLYIDADTDFTALDLTITQTITNIVLADDCTLTLTAAQAKIAALSDSTKEILVVTVANRASAARISAEIDASGAVAAGIAQAI